MWDQLKHTAFSYIHTPLKQYLIYDIHSINDELSDDIKKRVDVDGETRTQNPWITNTVL